MRSRAFAFVALILGLLLGSAVIACGSVGVDGSTVGGACAANVDCSSTSRCLTSGDFPGGYCTVNCAKHEDCPSGSRCIKKENGVCLQECESPADCRGGYTCKGRDNQFGGGQSLVCIKD